jgi:hypothetical protein
VRRVSRGAAAVAIGAALLACSRSQPPAEYASGLEPLPQDYGSDTVEPASPVMRAPLRSTYDSAVPPPDSYMPPPSSRRPDPAYGAADIPQEGAPQMVWRASPRWAKIKNRDSADSAKRNSRQAKFEAARAKADEVGIENLSQDDIEGLSAEQLKELRGY